MSDKTNIQWCDSTVNPIMGCNGCELYPTPQKILKAIDQSLHTESSEWKNGQAAKYFKQITEAAGEDQKLTTTQIYHARNQFVGIVGQRHGPAPANAAASVIERAVTCYAAKLHLNKAQSLFNPDRIPNKGYAPTFEQLTRFPGRVIKMARKADLLGREDTTRPWKKRLARLIFVSDMGDAFSRVSDFDFLKEDVLSAISSREGQRHLWLWLSKRPLAMARFSRKIGGFPENICAMTTLTCADVDNLQRVDQLRRVQAVCRGLSIEPLRERIPADKLNLDGIDWVIVGGESGAVKYVNTFHLEWGLELQEHCLMHGVAFFMKQFGSAPIWQGKPVRLNHSHGGNWDEWPDIPQIRLRQFPKYFHQYRSVERHPSRAPRR